MTEDWRTGGFGLYVHWPFCQAKCPYCDFNSHVTDRIDQSTWARAYEREIARAARQTPGRILNSIFFGGGTPSLMHPDTVASVIDAARRYWPFANDIEITLEANPGSVEAGRFSGYQDGGVNRISMGIQSLNDADLRRLGRLHSASEARAAFDVARSCFDRVSFDLIYARQDQTIDSWRRELSDALDMAVDHLSLYQLTIEPGTAFGDRYARGRLKGLPKDDLSADLYEATQEICDIRGMPSYEVSNHAREGARSRHNLIYWRYGDYVGVGPGAHGRVTIRGRKQATESHVTPGAWLHAVETGSGISETQPLSDTEQGAEYLLMGLRLKEGISAKRYAAISGRSLDETAMTYLTEIGMLNAEGDRITVSNQGFMVLNSVISELLPDPGRRGLDPAE